MSKLAKKLIISILVGLLCLNTIFPCITFGEEDYIQPQSTYVSISQDELVKSITNDFNNSVLNKLEELKQANKKEEEIKKEIREYIWSEAPLNYMTDNTIKKLNSHNNPNLDAYALLENTVATIRDNTDTDELLNEYINDLQTDPNGKVSRIGTPEDPLKGKFLSGILDGALGIILYPWKLLFIVPAAIIRVSMNSIAGGEDATLQNIFFNKIDSLNINIFEPKGNDAITTKIAKFYVAFRSLAIVLSLAVLIYIGIRMAMNSTGEDKAKYKQMLKNWVVGFALIFILQYIIYFVIKANELLVASLDKGFATNNVMGELAGQIWAIPFTTSFTSIVMYLGLLLMTFVFLITYIKRMITVCFLIIISPLISVTYAIDKVGNNKSEILNTWLKEFLYNVLIQPFHCVIFSVFIGTAMNLIKDRSDFGAMAFAIILTFCIFMGQKLVREIFGFKNSKSFYEKAVNFAIISSMYGSVKNSINDAKGIKGARNDRAARKQEKKLEGIVGAEPVTGKDMVKYRMLAEENRDGSNVKEKYFEQESSSKQNTENTDTIGKSKIDLNRPFKNAPRRVKRAARFYGRNLKKYTGYNAVNNAIKNRQAAKVAPTKLNNKDYAIALSEMYRQDVDASMSNIDLADEYERIRSEKISNLNANELSYRLRMESLKNKFNIDDDQIRDAIIYGSNQNRRWRG